jgi:peptidoglycan/xylan/chitin deacetylase (PgdA/CDA1 family)
VDFRWAVKRAAKWAVESAAVLSGFGLIYRTTAAFRHGCRILTYHKVSDKPEDSHSIKTDHFRDHMAFLADHHSVIGLPEMAVKLAEGDSAVAGCVAVTLDDGYAGAATDVRNILDRYRIPATFFIITGVLDGKVAFPGGPFLSWQDVREMTAAGFTFGSHTVSHRSLGEISLADAEKELVESRRRMSQELGIAPTVLSYPYGTIRDFSQSVALVSRQAGYLNAVTAVHGLNHVRCDPFFLKRTSMTAGDGLRTFKMILKGNLDPWVVVDKWSYRLQRPTHFKGNP